MKGNELGKYLKWNGALAQIIGIAESRTLMIEFIEEGRCPHCNEPLGKEQFNVIPTSPLYKESAKPIETICGELR